MIDPQRIAQEFGRVDLGDKRLNSRVVRSAAALACNPSAGFPKALNQAELEGYYRLVNNEAVTIEALLTPHIHETKRRAAGLRRVVVAEDTSEFRFSDEELREGLGRMDNGGQGFYAHFALAIAGPHHPLGVVGVEPWVRKERTGSKPSRTERYRADDNESLRWARMVEAVERAFEGGPMVVHAMDREADDYDLLAHMRAHGRHFVVRSRTDRRLGGSGGKLREFVRTLEVVCERDAKLSNRPGVGRSTKDRKRFPPRDKRTAQLVFRGEQVRLRRPDKADRSLPDEIELNVVHVNEPSPPEGCAPVEWLLYTSEPIGEEEQLLRVVDDYRLRWLIEEYFKALKTGCSFEKRQHETADALLNALGIFIPIAWSLLLLRTWARSAEHADTPASEVLSATQIQILRAKSGGRLANEATVREAMLAIARFFGGHLKSNGEPGWQTLGRGYQELLQAEVYWTLARADIEK